MVLEYRRIGYFNLSGIWVAVDEPWKDNFANAPGMPETLIGYRDPETGYYPSGDGIVVLRDRNKLVWLGRRNTRPSAHQPFRCRTCRPTTKCWSIPSPTAPWPASTTLSFTPALKSR